MTLFKDPGEGLRWRADVTRRLPVREWIRDRLPGPRHGFVALDIDLLLRCYGERYGTDDTGRFRLVEIKCASGQLTGGQVHMFPLIDSMLRQADPDGLRYAGFYVVWTDFEDWAMCEEFHVRDMRSRIVTTMSVEEFRRWLNFGVAPQ